MTSLKAHKTIFITKKLGHNVLKNIRSFTLACFKSCFVHNVFFVICFYACYTYKLKSKNLGGLLFIPNLNKCDLWPYYFIVLATSFPMLCELFQSYIIWLFKWNSNWSSSFCSIYFKIIIHCLIIHCHLLIEIIEIFPKLKRSFDWNMFWPKLKPHFRLKKINKQHFLK